MHDKQQMDENLEIETKLASTTWGVVINYGQTSEADGWPIINDQLLFKRIVCLPKTVGLVKLNAKWNLLKCAVNRIAAYFSL